MNITHNQWKRAAQMAWVVTLCLYMCGCSVLTTLPTWITTIENLLPTASTIISTIITFIALVGGKVPATAVATITAVVGKVKAGLTEIQTLITSYSTSASATVLTQIQAVVADVVTNLQSLFNLADITNAATQAKISAIVQLVVTVLQNIGSLLPAVQLLHAPAHTLVKVGDVYVLPSAKQLKQEYDAVLDIRTGDADVDAACLKMKHL